MTECCSLCAAPGRPYHRDERRSYAQCPRCDLVFVAREYFLSRDQEFAYYCLHENDIEDSGYRRFLERLAEPLCTRLATASHGLDFGCGPAPALATMLASRGHRVDLHDSFFCPSPEALTRCYDFITASEVVEHLHQPGEVLAMLWQCLRVGGWLAIMTKLVSNPAAFAGWHYKRDPTHVCFFSRATWEWWAAQRHAVVEFVGADVILVHKRDA